MLRNRFFADGNSSSSEETSDDEEQIQVSKARPEIFYASYNAGIDEEEDVKRVVRSEKENRYEEIEEVIEKTKQAIGIRDMSRVYECFETLIKTYGKARRFIEKEQTILQLYHQVLIQLNNFVNQCWNDRDWCNKLNKTNSNNLNTLRQKLRRYLKEQLFRNDDETNQEDSQGPTVVTLPKEGEILEKLDEIISIRGKRGIDYQNQLESLNTLREQSEQQNLGVEMMIKILLVQITVSLDYHHQGNKDIQPQLWTRALDYMEELSECINLKLTSDNIDDDLIAITLQMDEELTRILQTTDPHSQEYINRLKDELRLCSILDRFILHFELHNQSQHLCSIYLCIIEHNYYKYNKSSMELIDRLCKYIYANDILNRARTRASLCHIYYLALHDYYHEARDLMLMCHLQDTIHSSDISTQILYNRTMVQLGFCAFRFGAIHEAHQALVDLQSSNRIKELLGQEIDKMSLPYHMHINLQLIEWIYFISAMLVEIPSRRKHFHILMYQVEKQPILGPPETMRDHIVAASHALKTGDWNACVKFLINEKMKNTVWKLIPQAPEVMKMLIEKIKEESLRIYLITYATMFSTISMPTLADMFELPIKQVYGNISKMIIHQELVASIEDSNQIVMIHEANSSGIHTLSVELMEKLRRLHEQNEKLHNFSSKFKLNFIS